ncbi:hypothetical protein QAD02_003325 [Eretmocerus hayati]|uniref:Uncharacterized protein n=1 Tax=Eretmocerus hayati TaxID=131215 RepID=A0ACC2NLS2_9HYME|nr:hypothetical protein QAD02_003325 [Eretmocerus hayati]
MGSLEGAVSDCIPSQNYQPSVPMYKHVVKYPPNETEVGSLDSGQLACPDRYSELRGQFEIVPLEIIAACPDVRFTDCSSPSSTESHSTPLTGRTDGLAVNVTELLVVDVTDALVVHVADVLVVDVTELLVVDVADVSSFDVTDALIVDVSDVVNSSLSTLLSWADSFPTSNPK